jgi:hypothetical protein
VTKASLMSCSLKWTNVDSGRYCGNGVGVTTKKKGNWQCALPTPASQNYDAYLMSDFEIHYCCYAKAYKIYKYDVRAKLFMSNVFVHANYTVKHLRSESHLGSGFALCLYTERGPDC